MEHRKTNAPEVVIKFSGDALAYGKSDQGLIGIGNSDGTVKVYDIQQSADTNSFHILQSGCKSLSFSNDDRYVACGGGSGKVTLFDTRASTRPVCRYSSSHSKVAVPLDSLEVTPDGLYIVAGSSRDDDLSVWDVRQGRIAKNFRVGSQVTSLDSHPFKRHICVDSVAGPRVLNVSTFRFIPEFSKKPPSAPAATVQPQPPLLLAPLSSSSSISRGLVCECALPCARYSGDGNYLVELRGREVRQVEWFPFVSSVETLLAPWGGADSLADCTFVPGISTMVTCTAKSNVLSVWLTPVTGFKKNRNAMGTLRSTDMDSYLYSSEEPPIVALQAVFPCEAGQCLVSQAVPKPKTAQKDKTKKTEGEKSKSAVSFALKLQEEPKKSQTSSSPQPQQQPPTTKLPPPSSSPPPPKKQAQQQSLLPDIPSEESVLVSSIDTLYSNTTKQLQERLSQLEEMQRLWTEDPSSAVEVAVLSTDNLVAVSLLKALCAKPEWLTLRLASLLGPVVMRLMETKDHDMQLAAVSLVEVVLTKFGKLIASVVHRQKVLPSKQENSNVEDRIRYCCELYELFVTVQQKLPLPQKRRQAQQQRQQLLLQQGHPNKLIAKSMKLSTKITDLF